MVHSCFDDSRDDDDADDEDEKGDNEDATNKLKGGKVSEKWKPNALRGINAQHATRTNTPTCPNTSTRPSFVLYSAVI